MSFSTWLSGWLSKHPVKTPPVDAQDYTRQVMARIQEAPAQRPAFSLAAFLPQLAVGALAAALAMALLRPSVQPGVSGLVAQAGLLAALDDAFPLEALDADDIGGLMEASDAIQLWTFAEDAAADSDQEWLEQTLGLLEQFDDPTSADASVDGGAAEDDDWLQELQMLDAVDLTAKL